MTNSSFLFPLSLIIFRKCLCKSEGDERLLGDNQIMSPASPTPDSKGRSSKFRINKLRCLLLVLILFGIIKTLKCDLQLFKFNEFSHSILMNMLLQLLLYRSLIQREKLQKNPISLDPWPICLGGSIIIFLSWKW